MFNVTCLTGNCDAIYSKLKTFNDEIFETCKNIEIPIIHHVDLINVSILPNLLQITKK